MKAVDLAFLHDICFLINRTIKNVRTWMSFIAVFTRVGLGDKEQMILFWGGKSRHPDNTSCGTISALQKIRTLWVLSS